MTRGRLLRTLVPYPDMKPYRLVPEGRGDEARQHQRANYRMEEFRIGDPPRNVSALPVAGLPLREGETHLVRRGKIRPVVVVASPGDTIEPRFTRHSASWQHRRALLVAPYYGVQADGTRAGWNPDFVSRIQRAEYRSTCGTDYLRADFGRGPSCASITCSRLVTIRPTGHCSATGCARTPGRFSTSGCRGTSQASWFRTACSGARETSSPSLSPPMATDRGTGPSGLPAHDREDPQPTSSPDLQWRRRPRSREGRSAWRLGCPSDPQTHGYGLLDGYLIEYRRQGAPSGQPK